MAQAPLDRSLARPTDAPPLAHAGPAGGSSDAVAPAAELPDAPLLPPDELPRHVAIIMDGNRRWARARGKPDFEGHAAGVEAIRELLRHAVRRGVPMLTLYAFSRENWARSDDEVSGLFELLAQAIRDETDELRAAGRPGAAPRPARGAPGRDADLDRRRARPHVRGHPAPAQHRLELRRPHRARRRVPPDRRLGHPARRGRRADDRRGAVHGRPARPRPRRSGPAASSGSATS